MAKIILGVTGSIAAYRAADLASQLTKAGHNVTCVLTRAALEFVTEATLSTLSRNPVISDLFAEKKGWQPGHIQLADQADLLLIAPASANLLAEMAGGFAADALTAIALATRAPILIAPAMNGKMWQ
ncbi:MAG: phosphopantothenoylcysteine decarboxylase, partial [Verrucomicrobiales bacterium]|nr:phosphopantothenoylcysteine decarboxylase [Verrucomicrobiales bacterium]